MALLAVQQATLKGVAVTFAAATVTVGDTFPRPHDKVGFRIKNGSGGAITATLVIPGNLSYGEAAPDIVSNSIPAGADVTIGPIPPEAVDPSTGLVTVICSAVTSVTVAAVGH